MRRGRVGLLMRSGSGRSKPLVPRQDSFLCCGAQKPRRRDAAILSSRCAPQIQNPLPNSDDTLIVGGKLYLNDCVGCHGEPGQPPGEFGATFYPPAPQFPSAGTQFSEVQIFWVAKNGIRMTGMYPQGASYSDSQLWSLAAFIRRGRNLPAAVVLAIKLRPRNRERPRRPSMKNFIFGFLAIIVLILIVALAYLRLGAAEVRGDVRAPSWESRLMQFAVHASVTRSAQRIQNPLPHSNEQLIVGGKMYLDGCAG